MLALSTLSAFAEGKIVLRGTNLLEQRGLPDNIANIQEIADEADKKFHAESQRIIARMKKQANKAGRKTHELIKPLDFDSPMDDDEDFS